MSIDDREKIHFELLDALYEARRQVEYLEAALAHNAAYLGTGVEREEQMGKKAPDNAAIPHALAKYLDLVEPEDDISDFIGREGHDESRPRLGADAPADLRPADSPRMDHRLVGLLATAHPEDSLIFGIPAQVVESTPANLAENAPFPGAPGGPGAPDAPGGTGIPGAPGGPGSLGGTGLPGGAPSLADASGAPVAPGGQLTPGTAPPAPAPSVPSAPPERHLLPSGMHPDSLSEGDGATACASESGDACVRACLVMHTINDGVWDWNIPKESVYCSPRWRSITGVTPPKDTPPLDSLTLAMYPKDAEHVRQRVMSILEGKSSRLRITVRYLNGPATGWAVLRVAGLRHKGAVIRLTAVLSDITAQHHAEVALRASDEKFLAMANDSADLICRFDRDGLITYISANISRYNAASPADIVGKQFTETGITGDTGYFERTVSRVFATGQPAQSELLFASPRTGDFLGDCRFWPEFGVDGEVLSVSVLLRDMSYSRRIAENYYALFNRMEAGFILFEHVSGWEGGSPTYSPDDFALVVMNPAFSGMLQMQPPESSGIRLSDLMGEDATQWAEILQSVLTEEKAIRRSLRLSSGGSYEISAYSPERGRVACIVKDVTELTRISQEISLNEARLAALYRLSHMDEAPESAVVGYCLEQAVKLTGSAFGFLYMNHSPDNLNEPLSSTGSLYWSESVLTRPEGLPDANMAALPWLTDELKEELRQARVVNQRDDFFAKAFHSFNDVERYMLAPVLDDGRIVCIAGVANKQLAYTHADMQQLELFLSGMWFHLRRRWAVQDLRNAKDQAEAASRAKNEFLANVSHELRTPLNGILGMLQMLQQANLSTEQMEYIATANFSGRSLLRIISDILDFSRIEAGRFTLESQLFDFAATVRSTSGMFFYQAERKKLRFTLHIDPAIPPLLMGDDARVRQLIFNIVGNAFKFTKEGIISVDCTLLPYCKPGMRCIHIAVSDTGMGIPHEKIGQIFEEFTQIDNSQTRRFGGTGLGLTIVQRLVDLMGGGISVESEVGQGTTVHCSLPFALPAALSAEEPSGIEDYGPGRPMKILIAEDDPVSQFTLKAFMKRTLHEAFIVADGKQALEALLLQNFDCLVTDIQMPVMDGLELTRRIREDENMDVIPGPEVKQLLGLSPDAPLPRLSIPQDLPVVALTAYAMEGDRERFLGMGMDYYLAKPVSFAELSAVLDRISIIYHARKQ